MRRGLPTFREAVDPAWFGLPRADDGWSLSYRFDRSPAEQGNPSEALVEFTMPDAPSAALQPGAQLKLFERETGAYADLVILD